MITQTLPQTITGKRLGENFRIIESSGEIDSDILYKLLRGGDEQPCAVYVIRDAISKDVCRRFSDNFWAICNAQGTTRDDHVSVKQLGANQFEKTSATYLDDIRETRPIIDALFEGIDGDAAERAFKEKSFGQVLAEHETQFRPSQFQDRAVNICTARSWQNSGKLSLSAHEDLAQLGMAAKDGFEICNVTNVIGSQVCFSNGTDGDLLIWDIQPDEDSRARLGTTNSGYPYPLDILADTPCLQLQINTGDMYLISANCVHAVTQVTEGKRVTAGRFMGFVDDKTVVYWT